MELTVDARILSSALAVVGAFVPKSSPVPARLSIRFTSPAGPGEDGSEGLILEASDFDKGTAIRMQIEADVAEPGTAVVPAARIAAVSRTVPDGPVVLRVAGDRLALLSEPDYAVKVATSPPDAFPEIRGLNLPTLITVDSADLARALKRTLFITRSTEVMPYAVPGILVEWGVFGMALVALDGIRIARQEVPATAEGVPPDDRGPVLPSEAALTLGGLLRHAPGPVSIGIDKFAVCFRMAGVAMAARLADRPFARYRSAPQFPERGRCVVATAELTRALEAADALATKETTRVDLRFADGRLTVSSPGTEQGESHVSMPAPLAGAGPEDGEMSLGRAGEALHLAYKHDHLIDALAALDEPEVELVVHGEDRPIDYRSSGFWHRAYPVALAPVAVTKPIVSQSRKTKDKIPVAVPTDDDYDEIAAGQMGGEDE